MIKVERILCPTDLSTESDEALRYAVALARIYEAKLFLLHCNVDRLWAADTGPYASGFDPRRESIVLTWLNSEFSLLRLQYSHDRPDADDTDNVLDLQYQVSLGAHGAHKF